MSLKNTFIVATNDFQAAKPQFRFHTGAFSVPFPPHPTRKQNLQKIALQIIFLINDFIILNYTYS